MHKVINVFTVIIFYFLLSSCNKAQKDNGITYFNDFEKNPPTNPWSSAKNIDSTIASSGKYSCYTDSTNQYSVGINTNIPDELKGKSIEISTSYFLKKSTPEANGVSVLSISINDKNYLWKGEQIDNQCKDTEWNNIKFKWKVPANLNPEAKISLYFYNTNKHKINIDDITINFKELELPSFFPEKGNNEKEKSSSMDSVIYTNQYYSISYNNQFVYFKNSNNEELFTIDGILLNTTKVPNLFSSEFKLNIIDKNTFEFSLDNKLSKNYININTDDNSCKVEVETKTIFKKELSLNRSALLFSYNKPLTEIYKKNRQVQTTNFQSEYWLEKQGFKLGNKNNSVYLMDENNISSIQILTDKKEFAVNLDYAQDHPMVYFPLLDSAKNEFIEVSDNEYQKHDTLFNSFNFYVGLDFGSFPRKMKNPSGYLATYIWTEHADWGDITTNRAVFFGNENITNAKDATGGFVKHNIPVTKSVFYTNDDTLRNSHATSFKSEFDTYVSALKEDDVYLDFIKQLYSKGFDICLHTPDQYTTTREKLDTALAFMQKHFNSKSWIDHGHDNMEKNNREDYSCDGLNKKSKYYSKDLWEKYNIKYFWSTYNEDAQYLYDYNFNGFPTMPYVGFSEGFPTPDYWTQNTLSKGMYAWKTTGLLAPEEIWDYYFNEKMYDDLVTTWEVIYNHVYLGSTKKKYGYWKRDDKDTIIIHPGLEKALSDMASYRDKGLINTTTIADNLDYRINTDSVFITPEEPNKFKIVNKSIETIKGFSIAIKGNISNTNILNYNSKQVGLDTIIWFDIEPNREYFIEVN